MCKKFTFQAMKAGLAITTGLAIGFAPMAHAQDAAFSTLMTDQMNFRLMDNVRNRNLGAGRPSAPRPVAPGLRPSAAASASAASTRYRASPQVSARVKKQFSDWMGKQAGAEGGRQVMAAMQRTDPVQNWARLVSADGLRPGDAADALAGYWVLNWMIANRGDNTRAQTLAVREQVRPIMASNPAYARLNEPQRQELAEVLMLNFLIQQAAYTDALKRNDQNDIRRLADAAVARFRNEMGVDLRQLQLTNNGFVRR